MRTIILSLLVVVGAMSIQAQKANTLSAQEKKDGWVLLFDGKSFDGWRPCNGTGIPDFWEIKKGVLRVITNAEKRAKLPPAEDGQRQRIPSVDILYGNKKFENFELSIDWNVGKGGNSGVFYSVIEIPGQPIFIAGVEVQLLDNIDAGDNRVYNHLAGSLYDILPAVPQNAKPAGQWNTLVIRKKDGLVTHTQNGRKVCEYTLWTPQWYKLVAGSKFAKWEYFQEPYPAKAGFIGLQDHNDYGCSFRNIKIREL